MNCIICKVAESPAIECGRWRIIKLDLSDGFIAYDNYNGNNNNKRFQLEQKFLLSFDLC